MFISVQNSSRRSQTYFYRFVFLILIFTRNFLQKQACMGSPSTKSLHQASSLLSSNARDRLYHEKSKKGSMVKNNYERKKNDISSLNKNYSSNTHSSKTSCNFFIWDFLSNIRYHVCRRLVKDQIYEGMGGKKVNIVSLLLNRFHFSSTILRFL